MACDDCVIGQEDAIVAVSNAIRLAVVPNICLYETRFGAISNWKGLAGPNGSKNGLFAAQLANVGITGPEMAVAKLPLPPTIASPSAPAFGKRSDVIPSIVGHQNAVPMASKATAAKAPVGVVTCPKR